MPSLRIVVAEDHPSFREMLCEQLRVVPGVEVIAEAHDGWEAVAVTGRLMPDVLTLDLNLPGLGGLDVLRVVRRYSPETKVIIISGHDDKESIRDALRGGARGYVVKGATSDVGAVIQAVTRGEVWVGRRVVAGVIEEMTSVSEQPHPASAGHGAAGR